MSNPVEQTRTGTVAPKNGNNGSAAAPQIAYEPLGLNAQKVVAKRYSMKDENGEAIEAQSVCCFVYEMSPGQKSFMADR